MFSQSCPQWVNIVETRTQTLPDTTEIIKSDLEKMMTNNPEKIVLGCTHYPYLLETLTKFQPKELFIDPAEFFVEYIKSDLEKCNLLNPQEEVGSEEFFVSADEEEFVKSSKMFYSVQEAKRIDID